jgi:hypothetical protein
MFLAKFLAFFGTNSALESLKHREDQMELQKTILEQYFLLKKQPTFIDISVDTGIQRTRVFRLFNGATMKLSEYQIFQKKVKELMGLSYSLESIAFECSQKLKAEAIKEIEIYLKRKIEIWKLKQVEGICSLRTKQVTA